MFRPPSPLPLPPRSSTSCPAPPPLPPLPPSSPPLSPSLPPSPFPSLPFPTSQTQLSRPIILGHYTSWSTDSAGHNGVCDVTMGQIIMETSLCRRRLDKPRLHNPMYKMKWTITNAITNICHAYGLRRPNPNRVHLHSSNHAHGVVTLYFSTGLFV